MFKKYPGFTICMPLPNTFKILGNENTCTCQQDTTGEIPDVDPASEYENTGDEDGGA